MDHIYLTIPQLESLAKAAQSGAQGAFYDWLELETTKVSMKLLRGEQYKLVRPFRRLLGLPKTLLEARERAKKEIASYTWNKPWQALTADAIATKWLGVVKNVGMFQGFNIPKADYDAMIAWAAHAKDKE